MAEPITSSRSNTPPHPGLVLAGRYELARLLASGGMAEVWAAKDRVLERPVAVKVLHPHLAADRAFTERFRAEAIAAARLRNPCIVAIYDTCHHDGFEAIVMELVNGRTLREYLDERGVLEPDEVVHIGADVADALGAAHRAGVVHRDVKPANILLCDDGRVLVTDFGIAKVRDSTDLTSTGTMLGTVKYLAPEQVEGGPVDGRSDVYALGVVLFEALCGEPPFVADGAAATALARLHRRAPDVTSRRKDVPAALAQLIARSLAREPERRFSSAVEMRTALLAPRLVAINDPDSTTISPRPPAPAATPGDPTTSTARPVAPRQTGAPQAQAPPEPEIARTGRWALPLVVMAVVVVCLSIAAALVLRTQAGDDLVDRTLADDRSPAAPLAIAEVAPFDPEGDGGENDDLALLAIDGDLTTAWRTETYQSSSFGNLKGGVGLVLVLPEATTLGRLVITSPSVGWTVAIHAAPTPAATLEEWGEAVAGPIEVQGGTAFDLSEFEGGAVLIWITDLGEGPGRVEINDVTMSA